MLRHENSKNQDYLKDLFLAREPQAHLTGEAALCVAELAAASSHPLRREKAEDLGLSSFNAQSKSYPQAWSCVNHFWRPCAK